MAERNIGKNGELGHRCGFENCSELATHSVTDALQHDNGDWFESEPRFGCEVPAHRVEESHVVLNDGTRIPFKGYNVN